MSDTLLHPPPDGAPPVPLAALLDAAGTRQTVVVTRGGRRIAAIGPVPASNGAEFVALLTFEAADAADRLAALSPSKRWRGPRTDHRHERADRVRAWARRARARRCRRRRSRDRGNYGGGALRGCRTCHRAPSRRPRRVLVRVLETRPVEPYELPTAEAHGRLLAHVHRGGTTRGARDLVVAATAVATKRTVLTMDRGARCDGPPGVDCIGVT